MGVDEDHIKKFFGDCGDVTDVRLQRDFQGRVKGFCFVQFATEAAAESATSKSNTKLLNAVVQVAISNPPAPGAKPARPLPPKDEAAKEWVPACVVVVDWPRASFSAAASMRPANVGMGRGRPVVRTTPKRVRHGV